jgi:hypothetical protein
LTSFRYNETIPVEFRPLDISDDDDDEDEEIHEPHELYDVTLFTNEEGDYSSGAEEIHNLLS